MIKTDLGMTLDECINTLKENPNNNDALVYMYKFICDNYKACLVNKTKSYVYNDESDMIITNVMLRLQNNISKWDSSKGRFNSWLYKVIYNEFIMYYNKFYRKHDKINYFSPLHSKDEEDTLERIVNSNTVVYSSSKMDLYIKEITKVINKIGNPLYKELMIDYFNGLKYKELANKYDRWKMGTIKCVISDEKKRYKKYIENMHEELF